MHHRPTLGYGDACKALDAILAEVARAKDAPVVVAIVDDRGDLLLYARQDGALFISYKAAIRKAVTAALGRGPSAEVAQRYKGWGIDVEHVIGEWGTEAVGGLPIIAKDGVCLGGIGISGAFRERDVTLGKLALAAMGL